MTTSTSSSALKVGDAPAPLVCGPLTRTDFVRYAGASHDFNPNHHDEIYAQANGNKTVFGMGMLAGGYCARLLTDWLGVGALQTLRIRFASRCWPGDVLTSSAHVTEIRQDGDGRIVACEFVSRSQSGDVIVSGTATAALPGA